MINGLEGIPGSGKSYESVVYHVLVALQAGRKVITNLPLQVDMFAAINPDYRSLLEIRTRPMTIRGTWSAERVDEATGQGNAYELFASEEKNIKPGIEQSIFGGVWDYYSTWKHAVSGIGPLFVIDECHIPLPAVGTDKHVIEWFKLHRHFNADVLLMTQSFRDMAQVIARLIAMLVKVRKADILGRANEYIRKVHGGYRGAVISTEMRPYQPQYFPLYKSHTQGNSVMEQMASDVKPFIVKFNRFRNIYFVFMLIGVAYAVWVNIEPHKPAGAPIPVVLKAQPAAVLSASTSAPANGVPSDPALIKKAIPSVLQEDVDPEPLEKKGIHLSGMMRMGQRVIYTFIISDGPTRVVDLTDGDLRDAGYTWRSTGHCTGVLSWHGVRKAITCDAPRLAAGDSTRPVVVAVPGIGRT